MQTGNPAAPLTPLHVVPSPALLSLDSGSGSAKAFDKTVNSSHLSKYLDTDNANLGVDERVTPVDESKTIMNMSSLSEAKFEPVDSRETACDPVSVQAERPLKPVSLRASQAFPRAFRAQCPTRLQLLQHQDAGTATGPASGPSPRTHGGTSQHEFRDPGQVQGKPRRECFSWKLWRAIRDGPRGGPPDRGRQSRARGFPHLRGEVCGAGRGSRGDVAGGWDCTQSQQASWTEEDSGCRGPARFCEFLEPCPRKILGP